MKRHIMKLSAKPFLLIKNGEKTIESRLYDEKRQKIQIGDEIEFQESGSSTNTLCVKVIDLYRSPTFRELFSWFSPHDFGAESIDELLTEIYSFYSKEDEKRFGVIGVRVMLL